MNICIKLCWVLSITGCPYKCSPPHSPPPPSQSMEMSATLRKEIFRMTNGLRPLCQPGDGETRKGWTAPLLASWRYYQARGIIF